MKTLPEEAAPSPHTWGGGFDAPMHPALEALSSSLADDLPLAEADCTASLAWAVALARAGILTGEELARLEGALAGMRADLLAGRWVPRDAEDIHTAIEQEVVRRAGDAGRKLHTGRSRNDQVATAFRMAVRDEAGALAAAAATLGRALIARAAEELDTLLPAYTHMQRAQPVRLAHWLLAHAWPLARDVERLDAAARHAGILPLGAGAATGCAFAIDRGFLARELGFGAVSMNSIDAAGDRDFALEFASSGAILAVHLSRLAEELVVWSTAEFGFVAWPDALATGSSLMPNKKNPDLAELVRARAGAAIGDQVALFVTVKGIAGGYQRDLQETKPPVWRIARSLRVSLAAMIAAVEGIRFDRARMRAALTGDVLATEMADRLVARGIPFRTAHQAVSRVMAESRRTGETPEAVVSREAGLAAPLTAGDLEGLDHEAAVERRAVPGGTARAAVAEQLRAAREAFGRAR